MAAAGLLTASATNRPISTVAGAAGQGQATDVAQAPYGLAVTGNTLLVADFDYGVVRAVDLQSSGETVFAGTCRGYAGDEGPATASAVGRTPARPAVAADGTVYVPDPSYNVVRAITPSGTIRRFAGRPSTQGGFGGDGGPATNAQLDGPEGVAVDSAGNVYIAEHWNHLVRKVDQAGIITTVAGNRYSSATGDNIPATQSWLTAPLGVAVDASGTLLITDGTRLRSVSGGVITTVPGSSAVQMVRNSIGATNPLNATPGTIRGDFALDIGRNLIHASDAPATADRELALWFASDEVVSYSRDTDRWILE